MRFRVTFRFLPWLCWVFMLCILCTTRITVEVTNDKHERCHPTEYIEHSVGKLKFMWWTLMTVNNPDKTIYETWED